MSLHIMVDKSVLLYSVEKVQRVQVCTALFRFVTWLTT